MKERFVVGFTFNIIALLFAVSAIACGESIVLPIILIIINIPLAIFGGKQIFKKEKKQSL